MPRIISIGTYDPPYLLDQVQAMAYAKELFAESYVDIERLLPVFSNANIEQRHFSMPLTWYTEEHSFAEKNELYIRLAVQFGVEAITNCLQSTLFLKRSIAYEEIEAIFFISSTGIATPSIEARIMNKLPFSMQTKRIPIWGLGCAGGAAGLARAYEYCRAFPKAKVLVLCVELCSLTFQRNDHSKSNLIGTSLFADGVACALVMGDQVESIESTYTVPHVQDTYSALLPNSEEIMGWNIGNNGLYVIFSKSIPNLIGQWLAPQVNHFLLKQGLQVKDLHFFIAHPGGKKVLEAYQESLGVPQDMLVHSGEILKNHGNMSSVTILYVLQRVMKESSIKRGSLGLAAALGPGFSLELLLLEWR